MKKNISNLRLIFISFVFFYVSNGHAENPGEDLYQKNCMACHGYDGGGVMPGVLDFMEDRIWASIDPLTLFSQLKHGIRKDGTTMNMPTKGGNPNLTDDDLKKIIRYMHQKF